jgi:predicted anti-sigma-YlaC factor YlaD
MSEEWLTNKVYRVSPRLIDKHSNGCPECRSRLNTVRELFSLNITVLDEVIARDLTLDQLFEDCCDCVLQT